MANVKESLSFFEYLGIPPLWSGCATDNPTTQLKLTDTVTGAEWYVVEATVTVNDMLCHGYVPYGQPPTYRLDFFFLSGLPATLGSVDITVKGKRWSEILAA